jgi:hypothetical protein
VVVFCCWLPGIVVYTPYYTHTVSPSNPLRWWMGGEKRENGKHECGKRRREGGKSFLENVFLFCKREGSPLRAPLIR